MENKDENIIKESDLEKESEITKKETKSKKSTENFKKEIKKLTNENIELNKKNLNHELEILSLKTEIKKINHEYIEKAKSFAEKAQSQLDVFKEVEKNKTTKEINDIKKYCLQNSAEDLVGVLNELNRVINFKTSNSEVNAYIQGFKMISTKFEDVLKNNGINEISVKIGAEFDGSKHQVIDTIATNNKAEINCVAEIIHNGYRLHDRLLTPVLVKVYK